ncbi:iron complex outermembrane recepter protein [Luteibacter sp. UNCMF331Sha3.1]|uniref:TonB-dependent receptor n=1 Tax=Luteibacter sp. UNCMF331Sha3.1 TaxID=1502760 RepID=UPI0008B73FDD|nr:TonB-dependent receptor [Luteibacter sp. UNCMF331Sha3.1]SEN32907.1 iron complex outermembrane recepter protein [Luteibacter sp. UNCMF331Sha3.1]
MKTISQKALRRHGLALSIAAALACGHAAAQQVPPSAAAPAPAPQDAADAQKTTELTAITVTGSALPRIDVETPSPVQTITAEQIQKSGLNTVSDVVRSISADNSGSIPASFTAGFAAGSSGVALRGLTVNSTLVLIDGRRAASYPLADDGQRSFVDLNTIPSNAIERIEVLKDGASSLYGADAIAGVVNIILRPGYQGTEFTADVGTSQHGGGTTKRATVLFGGGDLKKDGWNAYMSAEYQRDERIMTRDRGYPYNTADIRRSGGNNLIGGQPSQNSGSIYGTVTPGTLSRPGDVTSGVPDPDGVAQPLVPCGPAASLVTDDPANPGSYCAQNFARYAAIQPTTDRRGLYGRFTIQVSDKTKAYIAASYYQVKTTFPGAPAQIQAGTPRNTNSIALPATLPDGSLNPNNPFAANGQAALINYGFPSALASGENNNRNFRLVGGLTGQWGDWSYDTALVLNHSSLETRLNGFLNYDRLIDVASNGTYNFLDPSANSPQLLASLSPQLRKTSTSDLQSIDFHVTRPLMDLGGGSLGLATGIDVRHEEQDDPDLNPNLAAQGLGIAHVKGDRTVSGVYVELDAPFLESLEVDVSGRYDHYSDFGNNFSPKIGIKWKPIEELALRGTFSKGFRAPSFAENGSSEAEGFATYTPPAEFQELHGNSGYVQPYGLGFLTRANKNIKPERSKSWTFGLLYQPTPDLSASLDYYRIKKTGVIAQQSASAVLDAYYAGLPLPEASAIVQDVPDPAAPDALPRPLVVAAPYVNQNALETKGLDLNLKAGFDFSENVRFTSELNLTKIISWQLTLEDGTKLQFVGTHGPYGLSSGAGTPRYRGSWANSIQFGRATITGTVYYTSGIKLTAPDITSGCFSTNTDTGANVPSNCRMASFTDFDLTGRYDINDKVAITGSVMNVFDKKAPFDPLNYAALNYNPTYAQNGVVGRFFTLGVRVKL